MYSEEGNKASERARRNIFRGVAKDLFFLFWREGCRGITSLLSIAFWRDEVEKKVLGIQWQEVGIWGRWHICCTHFLQGMVFKALVFPNVYWWQRYFLQEIWLSCKMSSKEANGCCWHETTTMIVSWFIPSMIQTKRWKTDQVLFFLCLSWENFLLCLLDSVWPVAVRITQSSCLCPLGSYLCLSYFQAGTVSTVLIEISLVDQPSAGCRGRPQIRFVLQAICLPKACLEWSDMDKQEVFSPREEEIIKFHIY